MNFEEVEVNSERWFDLMPLLNEEFRNIKGYEGLYQISNYGRVKSLKRTRKGYNSIIKVDEKILKLKDRGNYYLYVILCKNSIIKFHSIHRMVAEEFINKYDYKSMIEENRSLININNLFVNHKDENPLNNRVDNLEWCTHKYNSNYGNCRKKIAEKNSKKVNQYDLEGNFIKTWNSMADIERTLNINHSLISYCCNGKQQKAKGYIWKYEL